MDIFEKKTFITAKIVNSKINETKNRNIYQELLPG